MRIFGLSILILFSQQVALAQSPNLEWFKDNIVNAESVSSLPKLNAFDAAPTNNYDLKYHKCVWEINPDTLFIKGNIFSILAITESTNSLYFDAASGLVIDSVFVNGITAIFEHDSNALKIFLGATFSAGANINTLIYYHGNPASSGFGSFVKGENEAGNIIWTLSQPYGASDWWPCKQTLADKIDSIDIFITSPSNYKVGAPGLLVSTFDDATQITYHWKSNYPIVTYLIGITVSNYEMFELYAPHHEDSVLFYNLVYPENLAAAIEGVNAIVPSFELFSDIYGDYPFAEEKYGHMQFGWGGGMEHQTMSSVTHFGYELLVHEMAHQWFGDKITCSSWRDIWLNEGFATYSTWLSYDFSDDPNNYYEAWLTQTKDRIISKPDGSVWVNDTSTVARIFDSRLTYYKGAWLLHMLRDQLGDAAFFTGIKNYITDPSYAYNFVTTNDLIAHLEAAADTSLTEYFNDWFYGEGFPAYHLMWTQSTSQSITIALNQAPSHASVNFFEMTLPIQLIGDNDTLIVRLKHEFNGQLFEIPTFFNVNELKIDPDLKLLHANDVVVKTDLLPEVVQLSVYPSPTNSELVIQLFALVEDDYDIAIYNGAADRVLKSQFHGDANNARFIINVEDWTPGIYVIVVENSTTNIVQKVIVN